MQKLLPIFSLTVVSMFAAASFTCVAAEQRVIPIVGNDEMAPLLTGLNAIFSKDHQDLRFEMTLKGSSTGIPALAAGATFFAPMGREAWKSELGGFKQIHGYMPTAIRVGYSGWGPRDNGKTPPAVYVNVANPISQISMASLCAATVSGYKDGDINIWGQMGRKDQEAERRVHIYGLRDNGGFATFFRERYCGGLPLSVKYEALKSKEAVIKAVSEDPFSIGILGWLPPENANKAVRIMPLGEKESAALPAKEDVAKGHYPLSQAVALYIDKAPDKPIDPLLKAYLKAALSDEGQALIGEQAGKEPGYVPLSKEDLEIEQTKVDKL